MDGMMDHWWVYSYFVPLVGSGCWLDGHLVLPLYFIWWWWFFFLWVGGLTSVSIIFWACSFGSVVPFKWTPLEYSGLFFIRFCVKYMKGLVTLSMSALSLFWGLHSCGLYSLHSLEVTLMVYTPSSRLYLMLRQGNQARLFLVFFVYNVNLYMTEVSSILYHYMTLLTRSEHISNLTFFCTCIMSFFS